MARQSAAPGAFAGHSRRTAASMTMRAARSMSNDPSFAHIRCAQSGSVRGDVLQSGACPTVLANSDATAPAGQKSPLEAFSDRFFRTGSDHYGIPPLLPPLLPPLSSSSSPSPPFLLLPPPSSAEILKLSHQHRKKATRGSRSVVVASFETYPQSGGGLIQTYFSDLLKRIPRITVLKADLLKRIPRF